MKICVNVGHTLGGAGYGAVGVKVESVENRNVGKELVRLLKDRGHTVILSQVDYAKSGDEYLKRCVKVANDSGCDLFVSIHFNAFNSKANGCECYFYKGNSKSKDIASRICEKISALGFRNRGAKDGSGLYVIKNTLMDAVLVECCFIDNKDDMNRYDYKSMARAIFSGLVSDNEVVDKKLYRVCVGSFESYDNAKCFLSKVKSSGYKDAFIY